MPRDASYLPHGVIPAVLLPFNGTSRSTRRASARTCATLRRSRNFALTINAHSTEVASCTFDEQRRVLEIAQDEVGERMPVVNGVWADGSLEAARIARMAQQGGASALLVFPPAPFTLGQSPAMALAHFRHIVDATDLLDDRPNIRWRPARAIRAIRPAHLRRSPERARHQGLVRQRPAARARAAELPAAGQRALHPQRLAVLLAGARL